MTYEELVAEVARRSGLTNDRVRAAINHLPDALLKLEEGDKVRTPLGVFIMMKTKERRVTMPDKETTATVPSRRVVKLRPGMRLRPEKVD